MTCKLSTRKNTDLVFTDTLSVKVTFQRAVKNCVNWAFLIVFDFPRKTLVLFFFVVFFFGAIDYQTSKGWLLQNSPACMGCNRDKLISFLLIMCKFLVKRIPWNFLSPPFFPITPMQDRRGTKVPSFNFSGITSTNVNVHSALPGNELESPRLTLAVLTIWPQIRSKGSYPTTIYT